MKQTRFHWLLSGAGCAVLTLCMLLIALCLVGTAGVRAHAADQAYTFHPFDVPAELGAFTSAYGINNKGIIVGNFFTVDENVDGFVFQKGSFTDVAVPGASPDNRGSLNAVNDRGEAVGSFTDPDTDIGHSFVRRPSGKITVLPDAAPGAVVTEATAINNRGTIVGFYVDADGQRHGFILSKSIYTTYDYPGAVRTILTGINDHGQIVGLWIDAAGQRHGFLLDDGIITPIEVPGAGQTSPKGINNRGQVVGFYGDAGVFFGLGHGFLLQDGVYTTLDFPGATDTALLRINDKGVIVGSYNEFSFGLVATPDK